MENIKFVNVPNIQKIFKCENVNNKLISATQNKFGGVKIGFSKIR